MGVPKFYRWLSERYPLINQAVTNETRPVLDGLFLDMNGILHGATHGPDIDPAKPYDANDVVVRVFRYIDKLVRTAQPQKLLYMALDGVAPRAKMNQQRQRRFKSARDNKIAREQLIEQGEMDRNQQTFDSNAITPGTEFMASVSFPEKFAFLAYWDCVDDSSYQVFHSEENG
jgi:5'-3' exoribonuclease 1